MCCKLNLHGKVVHSRQFPDLMFPTGNATGKLIYEIGQFKMDNFEQIKRKI